jgi:hypothetical protein
MVAFVLGFLVTVILSFIVPLFSWQYFVLAFMCLAVSAISYARGLAVAAQMETD